MENVVKNEWFVVRILSTCGSMFCRKSIESRCCLTANGEKTGSISSRETLGFPSA